MTSMAFGFLHLLVAYLALIVPVLTVRRYRKLTASLSSDDQRARLCYYRRSLIHQWVFVTMLIAIATMLPYPLGTTLQAMGMRPPQGGRGVAFLLGATVLGACLRLIRSRPEVRVGERKPIEAVGAAMPSTPQERRLWLTMMLSACVSQEFVYRGFLLFYFLNAFPHMPLLWALLLSSLIYGLGQGALGWRRAVSASLIGFGLTGVYWMSGSLLPPIIFRVWLSLSLLHVWESRHTVDTGPPPGKPCPACSKTIPPAHLIPVVPRSFTDVLHPKILCPHCQTWLISIRKNPEAILASLVISLIIVLGILSWGCHRLRVLTFSWWFICLGILPLLVLIPRSTALKVQTGSDGMSVRQPDQSLSSQRALPSPPQGFKRVIWGLIGLLILLFVGGIGVLLIEGWKILR